MRWNQKHEVGFENEVGSGWKFSRNSAPTSSSMKRRPQRKQQRRQRQQRQWYNLDNDIEVNERNTVTRKTRWMTTKTTITKTTTTTTTMKTKTIKLDQPPSPAKWRWWKNSHWRLQLVGCREQPRQSSHGRTQDSTDRWGTFCWKLNTRLAG